MVFQEYMRTMERFLELQEEVMPRFLTGNEIGDLQAASEALKAFEMEDAVSRGFPVPAPQESPGGIPDSVDKPSAASSPDHGRPSSPLPETSIEAIDLMLVTVVSEKTGYPEDMLDLNLNMEADLGIDSIKRIEILGAMSERCDLKLDQDMERVAGLKTLQQVIDFLREHLGKSSGPSAGIHASRDAPEQRTKKADPSGAVEPTSYPMIGEVVSLVPGQKLEATRRISLDEDRYLRDHTLGGKMSVLDDALLPLPVMPLTMSMEILAEGGAMLAPGKILTRIEDIRAHQWISLESSHVDLKIVAQVRRDAPEEVYVRVYKLDEEEEPTETLVIEGIAVFAATYPEIPSKDDFTLRGERLSKWTPERLYTEAMFHGPSWQAVRSVDAWGEDGLFATLEVLPANGFFPAQKVPGFVTDPIVLDAAGQIVGFWTMEHLKKGFLVFPYRVKALRIYRPQLPEGARVKCQAKIKLVGTQQVFSDMDMIAEDGEMWMRLEAWEDKRFDLSSKAYAFLRSPIKMMASSPLEGPVALFCSSNSHSLFCRRIEKLFHGDESFWGQVLGRLVLNRKERETFQKLGKSEKRLSHWLLGRVVAKDAVRAFLKKCYGMELGPADVEITSDEYGRPIPTGIWAKQVESIPCLSLAHTDGMAVAVAGHSNGNRMVGIDVEKIRPLRGGFETGAFTANELELLNTFDEAERQQWILRFWCAKEALAKALGRGLPRPLDITVQEPNVQEGIVKLNLQGKFGEEFPDLCHEALSVQTIMDENWIVAGVAFERNGHG